MNMNKSKIALFAKLYLLIMPLVVTVVFFGYLKPKYNAVFMLDNIKGTAELSTYVSGGSELGLYYNASCEFNELTEDLHVIGYHYDVKNMTLRITGVHEMDFLSCNIEILGIPAGSYTAAEMLSTGTISDNMEVSSDGSYVHFSFSDPEEEHTITFEGIRVIPIWFWILYVSMLLLINGIITFLAFYIINHYGYNFTSPLAVVSYTLFTLLAGMYVNDSFPYAQYSFIFFNWLVFFAVGMLFDGILQPFWGTAVCSTMVFIWFNVNFFIIKFRNKPVMPSDLKALNTVVKVMDGYRITPSIKMIIIIIVWTGITYLFIKYLCINNKFSFNLKKRAIQVVLSSLILVICFNNPVYANLQTFAWDVMLLENYHREGMILTYVKSWLNSKVKKPEGYSKEIADNILKEYTDKETSVSDGIQPRNIIMVMNEAFSELRECGLDEKVDVMPFIDSLEENTMSGTLYVSVYGGGTCNTEFEALTGNTMAFFPMGVYPYVETVDHNIFSLAEYFSNINYYTASFHPNDANNWNRNIVYPQIGFLDFFGFDEYTDLEFLREKATDDSNYRFLEKKDLEKSDTPRFLFNVTMQNHSDYDKFYDLKEAEGLKDVKSAELKVYLSLIKESDKAVKQLVERYKDSDEPTMIIFFGDHEPGLYEDAAKEVYGSNTDFLLRYRTKFFIWTNYDTEEIDGMQVSANYLPYLILERGNFRLPPYVAFLGDMYRKYPVITSQGVMDSKGRIYSGADELMDDIEITKYRYIQYANLFDKTEPDWYKIR